MATLQRTIDFIIEQISDAGVVSARKMFGEYGIYCDGKMVALEWVPVGAEVDFANTLDAPGYAVLGLETGYDINERVSLFADVRNLTDEKYISNFSTITKATSGNSSVFYPGEGISAFAGIMVRF